MSGLTERFDHICERLERASARAGAEPGAVQLVAVSKTHGPGMVAELAAYWSAKGRPVFGESYMQEAREKLPAVEALLAAQDGKTKAHWHFIGHLQSRKAKDVVGEFELIHSVDAIKLARNLHKAWESRVAGKPVGLSEPAPGPQAILVQVNVGREAQKSGVDPEGLEALLTSLLELPGLSVEGLMCIPPVVESAAESRPYFALLRRLRDTMRERCGLALPHLSMGMSSDFEAAVEEGATLVRIGTDIFGARE